MADYARRKNERDEKTSSATYTSALVLLTASTATEDIFIWGN